MNVKSVMTDHVEYISPSTTLDAAAQMMRELDCGFLPVSDESGNRLQGVITDRDIAIRAVADGLIPSETSVDKILSSRVLYCCQDDDVEVAADSMREQQVYRLIVLDNYQNKRLCGVISLGDIARHDQEALAGKTASGISAHAT